MAEWLPPQQDQRSWAERLLGDAGNYLRNSYDGLARIPKELPQVAGQAWADYGSPAVSLAASMLPGAGFVQGAQDARAAGDAWRQGNYGQAAVSGLSSLGNTGLEALGPLGHAAMAVAPALRRGERMTLYHGTESPTDFARFDPHNGSNPHATAPDERAVFMSPSPAGANNYAYAARSGAGDAGPRVFKLNVDPGNTAVLDLPDMLQNNPDFAEFLHQRARDGFGRGAAAPDAAEAQSRRRIDEYRQQVQREHATFDAAARDQEFGPVSAEELAQWKQDAARVPLSTGALPAAVQWARQQGLDTATIRGLKEHGGEDQVVALTPGRVWNALDGRLMYGIGGAGAALTLGDYLAQQNGREGM